jgi:hypothetical protein
MKNIFIALCMLILTGCATRPFDPVEYNYAISTSILATRSVHQCQNKTPTYQEFIKELNTQTMYLYEYEKHHDENDQFLIGVTNLRQLVLDFMKNESTSTTQYCMHKLSEVQSVARALAKSLSANRIEICESDAMERLELYKSSLENAKISEREYAELVNDLTKLVKADNAYCSAEQKELLLKTVSVISSAIGALK